LLNNLRWLSGGGRRLPGLGGRLWVGLLMVGLVSGSGGCGGRLARYPGFFGSQVALRPASGDTERLLKNAHYLKLTGRLDLALKELEEAYQHHPHNLKVVNALAQGYDEVGDRQRVQQIYEEAVARSGDNPVLSNNLCFSYYRAGNLKKAEACFRQTLARHPHNMGARNNLSLLLCRQGRQDEARRLWQEVEGEAVAATKLKQVLAALGMPGPADTYAQSPPVAPKRPAEVARAAGLQKGEPPAAPVPTRVKKMLAQAGAPPQPETGKPPAPKEPVMALKEAAESQNPQSSGRPLLAVKELSDTPIKVCNGNGVPHLAHQTREVLTDRGFRVAGIANHRDFGMEQTTIYYGPQGEKAALALKEKMFHKARLEPNPSLAGKVDVQIILGHDLKPRQEMVAKLEK